MVTREGTIILEASKNGFTNKQFEQLWTQYDKDGNGSLDMKECVALSIDITGVGIKGTKEMLGGTAALIDTMPAGPQKSNGQKELTESLKKFEEMQEMFKAGKVPDGSFDQLIQTIDTNKDGKIDKMELKKGLEQITAQLNQLFQGAKQLKELAKQASSTIILEASKNGFTNEQFEQLWTQYDKDGNGSLDMKECIALSIDITGVGLKGTKEMLGGTAALIDTMPAGPQKSNGQKELTESLKKFEEMQEMFKAGKVPDGSFDQLIQTIDTNKDGKIDKVELKKGLEQITAQLNQLFQGAKQLKELAKQAS